MTTPFGDIEEESEVSDGKRKLNGDPGAIRWAASLPCACEAPLRRERATPSFGGWAANRNSQSISNCYKHPVPPENGLNTAEEVGDRYSRRSPNTLTGKISCVSARPDKRHSVKLT